MDEWVPGQQFLSRIDQVKTNLKSRTSAEWLLYWGLVPALLSAIAALPQETRDAYFILSTEYPWRIGTWFLSSYTHSQVYPHLAENLAFYFVVLAMIFAFEDNRHRFRLMAAWSFLAVPVVSSL